MIFSFVCPFKKKFQSKGLTKSEKSGCKNRISPAAFLKKLITIISIFHFCRDFPFLILFSCVTGLPAGPAADIRFAVT